MKKTNAIKGLYSKIVTGPIFLFLLWLLIPGVINYILSKQAADQVVHDKAVLAINSFLSNRSVMQADREKDMNSAQPECQIRYLPMSWLDGGKNGSALDNRLCAAFQADSRVKNLEEYIDRDEGTYYLYAEPIRDADINGVVAGGDKNGQSSKLRGVAMVLLPAAPDYQLAVNAGFTSLKIGAFLVLAGMILLIWQVKSKILSPINTLFKLSESIRQGEWDAKFILPEKTELQALATSFQETSLWLRQRVAKEEKLRSMFQQFVPASVAAKALGMKSEDVLEGRQYHVTAMVINIRNFRLLMDNLPPAETVSTLNEYFRVVNNVIVANKGIVCRYMGDTVLSLFGVPETSENHTLNAIKAALAVPSALQDLYVRLSEKKGWELGVGIGIASGEPIVGHFGSTEHMEYTALGDVVVQAENMEGISKTVPEEDTILLTETAYRNVMSDVHVYDIGEKSIADGARMHVFVVQGLRTEARQKLAA